MFSFDHASAAIKKSGSRPGPLSRTPFVTSTKSYETVYPLHIVQSAWPRKEKARLGPIVPFADAVLARLRLSPPAHEVGSL
jgi:hypothetical protein